MLQRRGPRNGAVAAERERERERRLLDRYSTLTDASEATTRAESPASQPSAQRVEENGRGPHPPQRDGWRPRQPAGGSSPAYPTREPATKPLACAGANPNTSLATSSSSAQSCTTSDFRLVEQELKELLSGCHRLVNSARGRSPSREESAVAPATAASSASRLSSPKPNVVAAAASPVAVVAHKAGSDGSAARDGDGGKAQDAHQVLRSATSLPISSVHGERSTDSTPTPCLQLQQENASARNAVGGSEIAVCIGASYDTNPSARVESPVDLFADALTEDQLSRSFEMQLQREQQMQLLQQHLQPGVLSLQETPNNPRTTIPLPSTPIVDEEDGHPATRREPSSPMPLFTNGDNNSLDYVRHMVKACRGLYDSRVYTAYRYQEYPNNRGKPMTADVSGSKATTEEVGLSDPQHTACPQRSAQRSAEVSVCPLTLGEHNTFLDHRVAHVNCKAMTQLQCRSAASRRRREAVNSTTPEIATSARHTENPSMRSGATGGKRAPIVAATADAATFQHLSGNVKRAPVGQGWGVEVAGGAARNGGVEHVALAAPCPETVAGATVNNGLDRGKQEHTLQQLQQRQTQPQSWFCRRYRRDHKTNGRHALNCHVSAATRFHDMVERQVAAFEDAADSTSPLPAFADSLVGAAISDVCPAVKRRQAQLKESQHAEERGATLTRHTYRGSLGTITTTSSTAATLTPNVRSPWDSRGYRHHRLADRAPQTVGRHGSGAGATRVQHRPPRHRERLPIHVAHTER
ncbi:uncharacterized protein Tco025E_07035 [Trypanosoma conorhini]|uniref:Uncharacterized protein n=1 Tax=Trypanosoma conorhini TaxID=83891 RepID=A0A422NUL7_9TRYP|nr:uncharacterized protein Tco025E_07035 [Trypanosoma conorhini]RNF09152.1 hypothetical protein Tco025E_07035 [Trypanosoma conorhini]